MPDDEKEQEAEQGKEDRPEIFIPRPGEKVNLNSEQPENKER